MRKVAVAAAVLLLWGVVYGQTTGEPLQLVENFDGLPGDDGQVVFFLASEDLSLYFFEIPGQFQLSTEPAEVFSGFGKSLRVTDMDEGDAFGPFLPSHPSSAPPYEAWIVRDAAGRPIEVSPAIPTRPGCMPGHYTGCRHGEVWNAKRNIRKAIQAIGDGSPLTYVEWHHFNSSLIYFDPAENGISDWSHFRLAFDFKEHLGSGSVGELVHQSQLMVNFTYVPIFITGIVGSNYELWVYDEDTEAMQTLDSGVPVGEFVRFDLEVSYAQSIVRLGNVTAYVLLAPRPAQYGAEIYLQIVDYSESEVLGLQRSLIVDNLELSIFEWYGW